MSYCRWSSGDVYVYADVNDRKGEIRCCSCSLRFVSLPAGGVYDEPYPSFIARGPKEMLGHLKEHQAVGHKVPKYALTRLAAEAKERAKKPIKYPVHFQVSSMECKDGTVVATVMGAMPICGMHHSAHWRKALRMKKDENGYAHPRDENTLDPKQVTCVECKRLIKAGIAYSPYRRLKSGPVLKTSTTK